MHIYVSERDDPQVPTSACICKSQPDVAARKKKKKYRYTETEREREVLQERRKKKLKEARQVCEWPSSRPSPSSLERERMSAEERTV